MRYLAPTPCSPFVTADKDSEMGCPDGYSGGTQEVAPARMDPVEWRRFGQAMAQLPYGQREVIILHLQGELTFKAIARADGVSINTIQSRYRYGLDKLRSLLNGVVEA